MWLCKIFLFLIFFFFVQGWIQAQDVVPIEKPKRVIQNAEFFGEIVFDTITNIDTVAILDFPLLEGQVCEYGRQWANQIFLLFDPTKTKIINRPQLKTFIENNNLPMEPLLRGQQIQLLYPKLGVNYVVTGSLLELSGFVTVQIEITDLRDGIPLVEISKSLHKTEDISANIRKECRHSLSAEPFETSNLLTNLIFKPEEQDRGGWFDPKNQRLGYGLSFSELNDYNGFSTTYREDTPSNVFFYDYDYTDEAQLHFQFSFEETNQSLYYYQRIMGAILYRNYLSRRFSLRMGAGLGFANSHLSYVKSGALHNFKVIIIPEISWEMDIWSKLTFVLMFQPSYNFFSETSRIEAPESSTHENEMEKMWKTINDSTLIVMGLGWSF